MSTLQPQVSECHTPHISLTSPFMQAPWPSAILLVPAQAASAVKECSIGSCFPMSHFMTCHSNKCHRLCTPSRHKNGEVEQNTGCLWHASIHWLHAAMKPSASTLIYSLLPEHPFITGMRCISALCQCISSPNPSTASINLPPTRLHRTQGLNLHPISFTHFKHQVLLHHLLHLLMAPQDKRQWDQSQLQCIQQ